MEESMSIDASRGRLATVATVALLVAGLAPSAATAQDEPRMGGSITVAVEGEPASVDPAFDYDFVSGFATSSISEPLLKFCENDTALCPHLATDWTVSADGLTYTLTIRDGVMFHDGTEMTVDDVVYSMERIRTGASTRRSSRRWSRPVTSTGARRSVPSEPARSSSRSG
jgi:peptide/nickel transport system substrate-binding protein